ncbi:synaptogenesis protein syg-2-like isoform X2 [Portunus trituberculatus]|uniref:synaptogenesis protein syg-2-like isoform X2 n=1 Tax=Portunus trituberculatus TaxID=210409 RepID=UPI001E1CDF50|nr:synaptogenesis protein syg-2-like isoform X2 [Portunus trituberculatus]
MDFSILVIFSLLSAAKAAKLESINTGPLFMIHARKGGRAELPCDVLTADPTDRVVLVLWYKDGVGAPIYSYDSRKNKMNQVRDWADKKSLGGRAHFDLQANPAELVIDSVKADDEGLYRCRVDFKKSPTRNARTNLTVVVPPHTPAILSTDTGQPVWTTVGPYNEGESMSLICEVNGGKPTPQVTWWMNGRLLDDVSERLRPHLVTNRLTINHLTRSHLQANLVCEASNSNNSLPVKSDIRIEMNFKPLSVNILGSREPLSAGKKYELVCQSVGARPSASLTWWLDGVQLTNASTSTASSGNITLSTLTFVPKDSDGGKYLKCLSESPVIQHTPLEDKWRLEVYYTPKVQLALGSNLSPEEIKEGDDVYFECNVRANPWVYKVVWHHNGMHVNHNVSAGVIVSNQSLVIQRVKRHQTGLYTCVASNIEGDGQSNAVNLRVQYAPVCAAGQIHVYGAARHEEVSVTCRLDAVPPVVHFYWRFNSSGDVVDIAESHVATQGLQSSLSYVARTELDYGTLLCWGENHLGKQRDPCVYKVVPAGPPDPPDNCSLINQTTETLRVKCQPGYDGGLLQKFIIEAYEAETMRLILNISENSVPDFSLRGLESGASYLLFIYGANEKGISEKKQLQGYTLKDVAEKRTAQVRPPPEELVSITPILAVVVGVVGSLVLVAIVAVVVVSLKRKNRPRNKNITLHIQTSLADTRDLDDKNPDLIPSNGSGGERGGGGGEGSIVGVGSGIDVEHKPPTTPEEGGFGSVHICASVPYPTNVVYSTYPRAPRGVPAPNPQEGELMYAELAFPPGASYPAGSLPRRKPDHTIYAQLDHCVPGMPGAVPCVPVSSGGMMECPTSGLMGGNLGGSVAGVLSGSVCPGMGVGVSTMAAPTTLCPPAPVSAMADINRMAYTPAPPPHGFGGHPLTPPVLPEEDEQVTPDTPLMKNPKESEV